MSRNSKANRRLVRLQERQAQGRRKTTPPVESPGKGEIVKVWIEEMSISSTIAEAFNAIGIDCATQGDKIAFITYEPEHGIEIQPIDPQDFYAPPVEADNPQHKIIVMDEETKEAIERLYLEDSRKIYRAIAFLEGVTPVPPSPTTGDLGAKKKEQ